MKYLNECYVTLLLGESSSDTRPGTEPERNGGKRVSVLSCLVGSQPSVGNELFSIVEMSIFCANKVVMHSNLYLEKENKDFRTTSCTATPSKACGCAMLWSILTPAGIVYPDRTMSLEEVLIFPGATGRSLWKKNRDVYGCLVFRNRAQHTRLGGSAPWALYRTCVFPWLRLSGRTFCRCETRWFLCCLQGLFWFPGIPSAGFLDAFQVDTGQTTNGG